MNHSFPRKHILAVSIVSIVITFTLMFSSSSKVSAKRTSIPIQLEQPLSSNLINLPVNDPFNSTARNSISKQLSSEPQTLPWDTYTVKKGHNLSTLFSKAGFSDKIMYGVLGRKNQNKNLVDIFPGEQVSFLRGDKNTLSKIKLQRSPLETILYTKIDDGQYKQKLITRLPEIQISYAEGEIKSSLFLAGKNAGLSQTQIMELANIFGWDIDFILDIRSGDKFNLIYEELYLDGEKYKNGRILAANFYNKGRELSAVLYQKAGDMDNYFTPEGKSMRKAFIRTPIDFARVSSHFNLHRRHPVLHRIRAHKGTDYAASRGTPIKATGDGKIIHLGRKGGYGRAVIIQHGQKISTLYAHMSKYARGLKKGSRVKQGQIIGYVGSSGLATGPHLHYEFRVNGVHKDSLKVKLPHAKPIPKKQLADFKQKTSLYLAQLATFSNSFQIAANH